MKHINLMVDEKTWDTVEMFAALNKTSISDLLLKYLREVSSTPLDKEAARAHFIELSNDAKGEIGPHHWTRDDLYGR